MEIRARQFGRILLLKLEDGVTEPDLKQVSGLISTIASRIGFVIADVIGAKFDPAAALTLHRLKKQYERSKLKFVIVSPAFAGADFRALPEAVNSLKSPDGARLIEIFGLEAALKQAEVNAKQSRLKLLFTLGVTGDSSSPLDPAIRALEDKHALLRHLFKTLASEVLHLEGDSEILMPGPDNLGAVRVAEAKLRALEMVNSLGVLD